MIQHEYEGKTQFRSSHSRCYYIGARSCVLGSAATPMVGEPFMPPHEQISLQVGACFAGDMVLAAVRVGTLPDGVSYPQTCLEPKIKHSVFREV